ncbi:hypothetical protein L484_025534 [Morus notabilis]|uniref:Hydroxyproline-rich glycoprotein family protein n=1 Tax=Morus notabilis TaxID=981085 RepID=W9RZL8_9ROSA|nr:uncharacterized protein At5g65660 [Morus notabilis]EXC01158.1 hypothetical protein L484_025534 [Morus notabilis]
MEEKASSSSAASRPTISFPLGIALLVTMLLLVTAIFLCCLYWDSLRSFLFSTSNISNQQHNDSITDPISQDFPHEKSIPPRHMVGKQNDHTKSVTVVMPGDDVPKFIGMACPCTPQVPEKITVVVHKTSDN